MGNSVEWAVSFYAAALLGAITVPVNTRFKAGELTYCLAQAGVSTLITADKFLKIDFIAMLRAIEPAIDRALPGAALPALRRLVVLGDDVPATAVRFDSLGRDGARRPTPGKRGRGGPTTSSSCSTLGHDVVSQGGAC
jgi:fatty-acyl-CoA synthase